LIGRHDNDIEVINLFKFSRLGVGGTGHARQFFIHAEIVLEGDGGKGLVFLFDLDIFLGFQRLMQAVAVTPSLHGATGELINNDDLVVADDIVDILFKEDMRLQRLVEVMQLFDIDRVIEVFDLQHVFAEGDALLGQRYLSRLLIDGVMFIHFKFWDDPVDVLIQLGGKFRRTGDDQRRSRFIDENGVHLIDDGEIKPALTIIAQLKLHIVAEIVETELVIGTVGDIGSVGGAPFHVIQAVDDLAAAHTEKGVDLPHPLAVAGGEIIVDGHHMHPVAAQAIEINRQGRCQGFPLTGAHLGDFSLVQDDAAEQLHIEMPLTEHPLSCLADDGKGLGQELIKAFALCQTFFELHGFCRQRDIVQDLDFRLQTVNPGNERLKLFEIPVVTAAENLCE